jgi:hypothetical protein
VLLLIQLGIAVSGAYEVSTPRSPLPHAEQAGVQDTGGHNENTCALCAAWLMHASLAPPAPTPGIDSREGGPASVVPRAPHQRQGLPANPSRAPPTASA